MRGISGCCVYALFCIFHVSYDSCLSGSLGCNDELVLPNRARANAWCTLQKVDLLVEFFVVFLSIYSSFSAISVHIV